MGQPSDYVFTEVSDFFFVWRDQAGQCFLMSWVLLDQGVTFDEVGSKSVGESFLPVGAVQDQEALSIPGDMVPSVPVPDFVVDHVSEELRIQLGAFLPGELDPVRLFDEPGLGVLLLDRLDDDRFGEWAEVFHGSLSRMCASFDEYGHLVCDLLRAFPEPLHDAGAFLELTPGATVALPF